MLTLLNLVDMLLKVKTIKLRNLFKICYNNYLKQLLK